MKKVTNSKVVIVPKPPVSNPKDSQPDGSPEVQQEDNGSSEEPLRPEQAQN